MKSSISSPSGNARTHESTLTPRAADIGRKSRINTADLSFRLLFSSIRPNVIESYANRAVSHKPEQPVQVEKPRQPRQRPRDEDQFAQPHVQQNIRNNEASRPREAAETQRTTKPVSAARQAERTPEHQHAEQPAQAAATRAGGTKEPSSPHAAAGTTAARTHQPDAQASAASAANTSAQPDRQTIPAAPATQAAQGTNPAQVAGSAMAAASALQQLGSDIQQATAPALQPVTDAEATRLAQEAGLLPASQASATAGAAQVAGVQGATTLATRDIAAEGVTDDTLLTESLLTPAVATATGKDGDMAGQQHGQARPQTGREPALAVPQTAELRTNATILPEAVNATTVTQGMGGTPATQEGAQIGPAASGTGMRTEGTGFSPGMAAQATPSGNSPVRADGSPLLASRIDSPVNSEEFREMFARQVAGLVVQGQDRAEIRLTPAELGPIRIRLTLNAEDAQLDISAAHASTRAAIEASMSTLKQMLADQGMRLADYRMDQGNTAFLSQQRQSDQGSNAGMQQSMNAFGQGGGSGSDARQGQDGGSRDRDANATNAGSVAATNGMNGSGIGRRATPEGNIDIFA